MTFLRASRFVVVTVDKYPVYMLWDSYKLITMTMMVKSQYQQSILNKNKKEFGVNPIPGVGGSGSGPGPGGDDDAAADQVDTGGLRRTQSSSGGGLGGDIASTTATVPSSVTISSTVAVSVAVTTTTSAAATSAATSVVGKGSSGGRSDKGKGPAAPKRSCTTADVLVSAAAVSAPTATAGTSVLELADLTSAQTVECCGFLVYTSDLLVLRRMEDDFLRTVKGVAVSIFRSRVGELSLLRGVFVAEDISNLRGELFTAVELYMSGVILLCRTLRVFIVELFLLFISLPERALHSAVRKPIVLGGCFLMIQLIRLKNF